MYDTNTSDKYTWLLIFNAIIEADIVVHKNFYGYELAKQYYSI
jgi:hypothetical protein